MTKLWRYVADGVAGGKAPKKAKRVRAALSRVATCQPTLGAPVVRTAAESSPSREEGGSSRASSAFRFAGASAAAVAGRLALPSLSGRRAQSTKVKRENSDGAFAKERVRADARAASEEGAKPLSR